MIPISTSGMFWGHCLCPKPNQAPSLPPGTAAQGQMLKQEQVKCFSLTSR